MAIVHRKIRPQGDHRGRHLMEVGKDLVKAIGDIGKGCPAGLAGEGHEGKIQNIVRAVGDKDLGRGETIDLRQLGDQRL